MREFDNLHNFDGSSRSITLCDSIIVWKCIQARCAPIDSSTEKLIFLCTHGEQWIQFSLFLFSFTRHWSNQNCEPPSDLLRLKSLMFQENMKRSAVDVAWLLLIFLWIKDQWLLGNHGGTFTNYLKMLLQEKCCILYNKFSCQGISDYNVYSQE